MEVRGTRMLEAADEIKGNFNRKYNSFIHSSEGF